MRMRNIAMAVTAATCLSFAMAGVSWAGSPEDPPGAMTATCEGEGEPTVRELTEDAERLPAPPERARVEHAEKPEQGNRVEHVEEGKAEGGEHAGRGGTVHVGPAEPGTAPLTCSATTPRNGGAASAPPFEG